MAEFKPYKDNEYLENSYYKIPQELFVSSLYKNKRKRSMKGRIETSNPKMYNSHIKI